MRKKIGVFVIVLGVAILLSGVFAPPFIGETRNFWIGFGFALGIVGTATFFGTFPMAHRR